MSARVKTVSEAHLFCCAKPRYSDFLSYYRWLEAMDKAVHPVHQVTLYLYEKYVYNRLCRRLRDSRCICTWSGADSNMEAAHFCSGLLGCQSAPVQKPYMDITVTPQICFAAIRWNESKCSHSRYQQL